MDEEKLLPIPASVSINRSRSFSTGIELGLWARSREEDEREFQQNLKVVQTKFGSLDSCLIVI